VLRLLLSLASLTVSGTMIWASLGVPPQPGFWLGLLDYCLLVYGVATIVLLAVAWWRSQSWQAHTTALFAASLFLVIVVGSFDSGMISDLEAVLLLVVAVALFINWLAVRVVLRTAR
jgi:hypothetical protein